MNVVSAPVEGQNSLSQTAVAVSAVAVSAVVPAVSGVSPVHEVILDVVGVGPGAPDLLTLRALAVIKRARVLAYVCGSQGHHRAFDVVRAHVEQAAQELLPSSIRSDLSEVSSSSSVSSRYSETIERLPLYLPMTKDPAHRMQAYQTNGELLAQALQRYPQGGVVLLCLGDPPLYGSWLHLYEATRANVPTTTSVRVRVIPGVSSVSVAMSLDALHVKAALHANQTLQVVTPLSVVGLDAWRALITHNKTVVVMKPSSGGEEFQSIMHTLATEMQREIWMVGDLSTPSPSCVRWERSKSTVQALEKADRGYFSLIVITNPTIFPSSFSSSFSSSLRSQDSPQGSLQDEGSQDSEKMR